MSTEICFILDRSGSMSGLEDDVIGGFNSFLHEQQKVKGKARVTVVLFDDQYDVLYNGMDIKDVPDLTRTQYFVRGSTALLDAVGKAITTTAGHLRSKDKVICVINTDGQENSSHEYTNEQIKALVEEKQATGKWQFIFFGVNVDKFAIAHQYGININFVSNYSHTGQGQRSTYDTISLASTQYRSTGTVDPNVMDNVK